jgi:hypothetical protein
LSTTIVAGSDLGLILSTSDDLAIVALAAAKATVMAVLLLEDENFTLNHVFPKLFVATFWS